MSEGFDNLGIAEDGYDCDCKVVQTITIVSIIIEKPLPRKTCRQTQLKVLLLNKYIR